MPPPEGQMAEPAAHDIREGLPVAPTIDLALEAIAAPTEHPAISRRVVLITLLSTIIGVTAALVAKGFLHLIDFVTNLVYHGRLSLAAAAPTIEHLGAWSILIPVAGALIVGLIARYGSAAIRGHGIPEVMEKILYDRSRIGPKLIFLKPLSAAIAIGTGG